MLTKLPVEVKYGLLMGIGIALFVLLQYIFGFHTTRLDQGKHLGFLSVLIPVVTIYFLMRRKRDTSDKYGLGQAVKSGFVASLVSAVLLTGFYALYNSAINPKWPETAVAYEVKQMQKAGLKQEDIDKNAAQVREFFYLPNQLMSIFTGTTINGTILSVIMGLVVRKNKADDLQKLTVDEK